MSNTKDVSFSVDLEKLNNQLNRRQEQEFLEQEKDLEIRSTVFSLGNDPRVGSKKDVSSPDFLYIELLKDGKDNPYVELHWRIPRFEVDKAGVQGFEIYRRIISDEEIVANTRDKRDIKKIPFTRTGFDKISKKSSLGGRFYSSSTRKAALNINKKLIPQDIFNNNLESEKNIIRQQFNTFLKKGITSSGASVIRRNNSNTNNPIRLKEFSFNIDEKRFHKVGYVDYSKFLAKEKKSFLQVIEREFIDLEFKDKNVKYGDVFEYYIISITEEDIESPSSNKIKIKIDDLTPIRPPVSLALKQLDETSIQIRACADSRDNVGKIIFYRKSEDEISFSKLASVENINDCVNIVDTTVRYNKEYSYRVFMENIFGSLSEPRQIESFISVQRITPQSRSNNLKIPIISAVQDQNSDFVKITLSSNDPNVAYYELERKDLTIYERKFSAPSNITTHYGESDFKSLSWKTNKFFVDKYREFSEEKLMLDKNIFNRKQSMEEIEFIDTTVQLNHIYQYRVKGCDLFCNPSPYNFALVKTTGKKRLRSPINIRIEVLRGTPFRFKLLWDDDNLASKYSNEELFVPDGTAEENKVVYKVQRRKIGETTYESFPNTSNKFLIDEAESFDAIQFSSRAIEDSIEKSFNIEQDQSIKKSESGIQRPFNFPDFLRENDIYFYRIQAIDSLGEVSNFTKEFKVITLPELSDPLNFKLEALNTKTRPLVIKLSWNSNAIKAQPDHWIIERKVDVDNDSFEVVGRAYIKEEFFDRNVQPGNTFIYRIKSIDNIGRQSQFFEERITL